MSSNSIERVWINPWKYFSATARMDEEEKESILQSVMREAEAGNAEALRRYDFVCLENPYIAWRQRRRNARGR